VGLDLSMLSLALFGASAVAFARQRRAVLVVCGGLFVAVSSAASLAIYWPVSPAAAVAVLLLGQGVPLVGLGLYAADRLFAPFCVEMTYAALLCWLIWPLMVLVNFVGLLL